MYINGSLQILDNCSEVSEEKLCQLHLRDKQTNEQRDASVCPFVFLFVRCVCQGVHPMGERSAMLHRKSRWRDKNPGSTNKYMKFGQLMIRKIIKLLPP